MHKSALLLAGVAALAISRPAVAEVGGAAADAPAGRMELAMATNSVIVVTGTRDKYGAETSRSATRTDTPLQDIPQAISVVTERQIDDQAMRSIGDVLRYVPGTMIGQGEGHRDQVTIRGNNSTADFFVDGLRDDIQYYRPLYNLDRVEVLRGPNAMIFGRGGGGGVINRVTKQPGFAPGFGASGSVDTFGAWYVDADLNHPFAANFAGRINAVYEEFANHRDVYGGRLIAVNPTLRFLPGSDTGIGLSYEYVDDERVVDRGVPAAFAGTLANPARPLTGFRNTFFGAPGVNRMEFEGHILRGTIEHRFTPDLTFTGRLQYADYDKLYRNAFPATPVTVTGGVPQIGVSAYQDAFQRQNLFSQNDLVWKVETGNVGHTILAGVEIGQQDSANQRMNGFFDSGVPTSNGGQRTNVNLTDPFVIPPITFRGGPGTGARSTLSDADVLAFYVQDQVEIGPIELIGGLRYDRFDIEVTDLMAGTRASRTDHLWSPRLGIVLHPIEPVSIYASYSRSYLPQSGDQFNSLDVTAANLEPERFDNYEIGVKWAPIEGVLLSAALYQLDRTNSRAPGPTPGTIVQTGAQRSRGLEIEASGQITPRWQVSAGYALQDAEIRTTTAAAPAGREVAQVPRHQLGLWTRYDFTPMFGAGIGLNHQSRSFASISNTVVLPAYTRVDAALFVRLTHNVEAQINVENLFGEDYFPTGHNDNNITTGAPRSARVTVKFRS